MIETSTQAISFRELQQRLAARAADMYAEYGENNPVAVAVDIVADEIMQMLEDAQP